MTGVRPEAPRAVDPRARAVVDRARQAGRAQLDEAEGKQLLAAFGLPVPAHRVAAGPDGVPAAAAALAPPVAVKILSPHVVHKTDIGGVVLDLDGPEAAGSAARAAWERADGAGVPLRDRRVLVEEMAPPGVEVLIGTSLDPVFGRVLAFGPGGVHAEVYADVVFRHLPLRQWDFAEMVDDLRGADLLRGTRGAAVDLPALAGLVGGLAGHGGVLESLRGVVADCELNPVIVSAHGAQVVDAVVTLHG